MTSPNVPRNAYTDSPEQHPNLILGSLQLLFWIFFRPSAWRNHLKRNPALWKLRIQAFLVVPVLANSIVVAFVLWLLGAPVEKIASGVVLGVVSGVVSGELLTSLGFSLRKDKELNVALGIASGMLLGVALGVLRGVASDLVWGVVSDLLRVASDLVWGVVSDLLPVASDLLRVASDLLRVASDLLRGVQSVALDFFRGWLSDIMLRQSLTIWDWRWWVPQWRLMVLMLVLSAIGRLATGTKEPSVEESVEAGVGVVVGGVSVVVGGVVIVVAGVVWGVAIVVAGVVWGVVIVVAGVMWGVVITISLCLPVVLYPFLTGWNILVYQLDKLRTANKPSLLRWHSAFWDERQRLPLYCLDKHVLLVTERNPEEAKAAFKYLSTSRQRWAAPAVQIELDARGLERCKDVAAIGKAHRNLALGELDSPVSFLLSGFSRISEDIAAALYQNSSYNQRLALTAVADKLNGLVLGLTRSSDKYAPRFRPIATQWHEIVTNYVLQLAEAVELRQEIDNPYIIGVPLTEQQIIFTGRTDIGTRIEQLLLDRRRPPLLLYGQRRMGKTSLLHNLGRLLPSNIILMFVDLQGPVSSASGYAGFLYNIARSMADSAKRQSALTLPSLKRETLQDDPFTRFDEWLDEVEQALQQNIALLALDEFEVLDNAITKGRFDREDVLGMLRHLIQHRPRFKVLLAGSHTIEEFQRWASYLINVQVVHISYLKELEARQLIEQPVQDFTLRYEPNAVDRVLQLTRCHPFLIQLLCAEIIALKNEQDPSIRRLATLADVEAAIPEALSVGSFFFADIQSNQADAAGLAILQFLAARGEGAIVSRPTILQYFPDKYDALNLLLQRELIEEVSEGYRFQVELIRRWFASSLSVL
ncbi:ATP-binding protein [Microcoleus sp. Pol11C2]|uniref:AAA family ATPase n=1 Tax=Microcoleus sp. Pol11C2 TaxID=3055389 RepID=UPI002FD11B20